MITLSTSSPPSSLSPFEREMTYNALDCLITAEVLETLLKQIDPITRATYDFSKSLQAPVLEMRIRGVRIDLARRAEVIEEFHQHLDKLERNLDRIVLEGVGMRTFNWRSNNDLKELFYDRLHIPPIRYQGRITVDRNALEKMEAYSIAKPVISHIIAMRDIGKKIGMLQTDVDPDGRMRTSYNICGTDTGRFSSSLSEFGTGTNLQNITESLRSVFIADPGYKLAYFDAEQGESRVVGAIEYNLFGDSTYLDACEGGDLHTNVAKLVWPDEHWTGDPKHDRMLAEQPYYRHYDRRFMCKKIGHGCLTSDHEILTPQGWVSITEKPPMIMIWSETTSYFDEVLTWSDFIYEGDIHQFEGNSISAKMTNDHRIPYKSDIRSPLKTRLASDGPGAKMPLGDNFIGGHITVPARYIAALMADGYVNQQGGSFHLKKDRKIERLKTLCELYSLQWKEYVNYDDTVKIQVWHEDYPKHPGPFMFLWTEECLRDFIDELKYWDGHVSETAISIASTKKEDLEWYQTFGRLLGIGGQIQKPQLSGFGSIVYRLQQNNRRWANGESVNHSVIESQRERMLCPTVSTGWFYVRRNGKIFITGNTNYGGRPRTLAQQAKVELSLIEEFQPKYFAAFPAHKRWHQYVESELRRTGTLINLTGRKRQFWGRLTDDSTLRAAIAYDPQGSLADIVNAGMLQIWRARSCILLMQIHDAVIVQYPEELEDELIPQIRKQLETPITLQNGRRFILPYGCQTGWNWGHVSEQNPDGLASYKPGSTRRKTSFVPILDRSFR